MRALNRVISLLIVLLSWWTGTTLCPLARAASGENVPFAGIINGNRVNVRVGPNLNFEVLTRLNQGNKVIILDQDHDWYKIRIPESSVLFVSRKYVKSLPSGHEVTSDKVNVRAGAGLNYNVAGQLNSGCPVTVLAERGDWYQIKPPEEFTAWVHCDFVAYYSTVESYLKEEKLSKEIGKRFADYITRANRELEKPAEEVQLQPLLEEFEEFVRLHSDHPEAESAQRELKQLRLKKAESNHYKAARELRQAKQKLEAKIAELSLPPEMANLPPPAATGKVEDLGMIINRPGTHKLTTKGRITHYLRSDTCNLNRYIYHPVAVWGKSKQLPGWQYPVILVEKIKVLSR